MESNLFTLSTAHSGGLFIPLPLQPPVICTVSEDHDRQDVSRLPKDFLVLRYVGCRVFQHHVEISNKGNWLRTIDRSEPQNAVEQVMVQRKHPFQSGRRTALGRMKKGKSFDSTFFSHVHDQYLCVLLGCSVKGSLV